MVLNKNDVKRLIIYFIYDKENVSAFFLYPYELATANWRVKITGRYCPIIFIHPAV